MALILIVATIAFETIGDSIHLSLELVLKWA